MLEIWPDGAEIAVPRILLRPPISITLPSPPSPTILLPIFPISIVAPSPIIIFLLDLHQAYEMISGIGEAVVASRTVDFVVAAIVAMMVIDQAVVDAYRALNHYIMIK
ncbi:hypothetical protein LOK49_LG07G00819 [Camellia lanceoleosa]|uniref:Uncharacterized protein n=1 Tax=Camellia lanceoleosa TaxID=1840588 RepID=A0ACC0H4G2_9ERIC|nr:hypothetical protein LOK49_LG07G00819 [Camellia lanceoleosa]